MQLQTQSMVLCKMQKHNQEVCLPRTLTPLPLVPALHFTAYATSDTINAMQNHNQEIIFLPKTLTPLPGPHPHFTACLKGYYKFFSIALYSFQEWSANELCCIMFGLGMWGGGQRGGAQRQCTGQRKKKKRYPVRNMCRGSLSLIYIYIHRLSVQQHSLRSLYTLKIPYPPFHKGKPDRPVAWKLKHNTL